jgi:hypothetical protein
MRTADSPRPQEQGLTHFPKRDQRAVPELSHASPGSPFEIQWSLWQIAGISSRL